MGTLREIQSTVARHYGVSVIDLCSDRRARKVVWPRHVAMYLGRELTAHSLPSIGRAFGGRDHTTVMHGIGRVESRMADSAPVAEEVAELCKSIVRANGSAAAPRLGHAEMLDRLRELLNMRHAAKTQLAGIEREIADVLREAGWEKQALNGSSDIVTAEASRASFTGSGATGVVTGQG